MSDEPDHRLYAQAKGILQRVFEMRPAERGAYLESACGNSPELRAEVFSLLAAHEQINSQFLDNPFTLPPDADTAAEDRDLSGQRVGAYKLERLLGRGGMGAVYLASRDDGEFTKHVAIKFIRASAASPALLKRFRAERQILADIDHPNIARLIDGGTADGGMPFFIMEYVPGETLTQTLVRGPLPLDRAIKLATAVAEVLEAVHAKGLVFRDLKPSNIMLTEASGVKVLDFGIAKITFDVGAERSTSLTEPGWIVGSPRYMSPEQASGEPVDARSDVFSFGVVIFEALTGRLPFNGETRRDYLKNLIATQPEPLPPEIPAPVRAVVERCLSKNPADRFASGKEVADAMRDVVLTLGGRKTAANTFWAAAALLAVVAAIGVWSAFRSDSSESALLSGPPQLITTSAGNEMKPRFSPDLKWLSFVSDWDGPEKIILRQRPSGDERVIAPPGDQVLGHEWSPSSDHIAYMARLGHQTTLTIAPIDGGKIQVYTLRHSDAALVRWIGSGIYYLAEGSLWRFDTQSGQPREVTTGRGALRLRDADVSADEQHIVFAALEGSVSSIWYGSRDGSNPVRLTQEKIDPRDLRWRDAQARQVVYVSNQDGMVDIWQLDVASHKRQRLTVTETREGHLDISRDGAILIYEKITEAAHLTILDPADKAPTMKQVTSDTLTDLWPDASRSARDIVFQRSKTTDTALGIVNSTIEVSRDGLATQPAKLADGYAPEMSADGHWVGYTVEKRPATTGAPRVGRGVTGWAVLWLVNVETGRPLFVSDQLVQTPNTPFPLWRAIVNMAWSPSEPRLYFLARDQFGKTQVLSATPWSDGQGVEVRQVTDIKDEGATVTDVQVSSDGSRLSYLLQSATKAVTELHALVISRKEDSVSFSEPAGTRLNCLGWTGDDSIVVIRTGADVDSTDVLFVKSGRKVEVTTGLRDVVRFGFALDPRRRVVYFTRQRGTIHSLYALNLDTRNERLLFQGEPHGPSLSGIRVLADGRLLFSFQAQNYDIVANTFGR